MSVGKVGFTWIRRASPYVDFQSYSAFVSSINNIPKPYYKSRPRSFYKMTCPLIIVRLKFLEEDTFPEPPSVQGKAAQELETIYKAIRKLRSKATGSVEILEAQALEDPKDLTLFIGTQDCITAM